MLAIIAKYERLSGSFDSSNSIAGFFEILITKNFISEYNVWILVGLVRAV